MPLLLHPLSTYLITWYYTYDGGINDLLHKQQQDDDFQSGSGLYISTFFITNCFYVEVTQNTYLNVTLKIYIYSRSLILGTKFSNPHRGFFFNLLWLLFFDTTLFFLSKTAAFRTIEQKYFFLMCSGEFKSLLSSKMYPVA